MLEPGQRRILPNVSRRTSVFVSRMNRALSHLLRTLPRRLSRHRSPWLSLPFLSKLPRIALLLLVVLCASLIITHLHVHHALVSSAYHRDGIRRVARSAVWNRTISTDDDVQLAGVATSTGGYLEVVEGSNSSLSSGTWPPTVHTTVLYRSYGGEPVDLRLIVLAYNRPEALTQCLEAINAADYLPEDRVTLHVWIDGRSSDDGSDNTTDAPATANGTDDDHAKTVAAAEAFNFTRGEYRVHARLQHVGVQGQWMTVWRPPVDSTEGHREVALIIEDDITVSPFYWRWLRLAHRAYGHRDDVSGYSVSHPEMQHATGSSLEVPFNHTVFMYPVICTWGFSPQPNSWRQFQNWFFDEIPAAINNGSNSSSFEPLVDGILPTEWFVSERQHGRETNLWEQWHIYFTHTRHQYTVIANPGTRVGLLAVNRHERGLHDGLDSVVGATQPLAADWSERFELLPMNVTKLGYDGVPLVTD